MDKTTFINALAESRAQWDALLAQIDERWMLEPDVEGKWSVKDIIAHVMWNEQEMVPLMQTRSLIGSELWDLSQDERNEAQFGATYTHRSGPWFNFTGRYDSGIPTDFEPGDFAGFDPNIQQQLSLGHKRIRPRTLLSTAAGIELLRESRFPVTLQVSVNNLTNRFYLYNFQSVFSGTHIGRPREVVGRVTLHWRSEKK